MKPLPINMGDIYRVGGHLVGRFDSRDTAFVSRITAGVRINIIMTDVPYAIAYVENKFLGRKTPHIPIANDHLQSDEEFATFTRAWLDAARPCLAPKNAAYAFCSDKMIFAFRDGMVASGFRFGQLLHWIKTAANIGRLDYAPQHETLLYFWHGSHEFMKSHDKSVIIHPKPAKNTLHPTCKPIPILRRLILNSSRIGDVVYDPFAGSGTTALAAEQTGRHSVSIELEERYCRTIIERLVNLTGKEAVLLSPSRHDR